MPQNDWRGDLNISATTADFFAGGISTTTGVRRRPWIGRARRRKDWEFEVSKSEWADVVSRERRSYPVASASLASSPCIFIRLLSPLSRSRVIRIDVVAIPRKRIFVAGADNLVTGPTLLPDQSLSTRLCDRTTVRVSATSQRYPSVLLRSEGRGSLSAFRARGSSDDSDRKSKSRIWRPCRLLISERQRDKSGGAYENFNLESIAPPHIAELLVESTELTTEVTQLWKAEMPRDVMRATFTACSHFYFPPCRHFSLALLTEGVNI